MFNTLHYCFYWPCQHSCDPTASTAHRESSFFRLAILYLAGRQGKQTIPGKGKILEIQRKTSDIAVTMTITKPYFNICLIYVRMELLLKNKVPYGQDVFKNNIFFSNEGTICSRCRVQSRYSTWRDWIKRRHLPLMCPLSETRKKTKQSPVIG